MAGSTDTAVDRQARAYNARDLDAFVACYAEGVVIEDGDGNVLMTARDEMREQYGPFFAASPDLHAEIVSRMRVASYVVDEERITGSAEGDLHAVAVYRLNADGLIDHVRLLV